MSLADTNFKREKKLYQSKTKILEVIKKRLNAQETLEALKDVELGEDKGKI